MDFKKPITNLDEAKAWLKELYEAGKDFHLEDDPRDICDMSSEGHERVFTDEEAEDVDKRRHELYSLDWSQVGHKCPIGYLLELMGE